MDSGSRLQRLGQRLWAEPPLGTLGPTRWRGGLQGTGALSLRDILFVSCLTFLSVSPISFCSLIPLSHLGFPLFPSSLPPFIPLLALEPSSFFLRLPYPSSSQPIFHISCPPPCYPLLFLTLHLLSPSLYPFTSLTPSISYSPASSPTLFFPTPTIITISHPPTPYSFLPSLSSSPSPLCPRTPLPLYPTPLAPSSPEPLSYPSSSLFPCLLPLLVPFHLLPLPSHSIAHTFYPNNFTLKSLYK